MSMINCEVIVNGAIALKYNSWWGVSSCLSPTGLNIIFIWSISVQFNVSLRL